MKNAKTALTIFTFLMASTVAQAGFLDKLNQAANVVNTATGKDTTTQTETSAVDTVAHDASHYEGKSCSFLKIEKNKTQKLLTEAEQKKSSLETYLNDPSVKNKKTTGALAGLAGGFLKGKNSDVANSVADVAGGDIAKSEADLKTQSNLVTQYKTDLDSIAVFMKDKKCK